jgi:hypothetical protein
MSRQYVVWVCLVAYPGAEEARVVRVDPVIEAAVRALGY